MVTPIEQAIIAIQNAGRIVKRTRVPGQWTIDGQRLDVLQVLAEAQKHIVQSK